MEVDSFIDKREVDIDGKKFIISKIPAVQAQELYGKIYRSITDVGDVGMTFLPKDVTKEILSYTAVKDGEDWKAIDDDYTERNAFGANLHMLMMLQIAMIKENYDFLFDGRLPRALATLRNANLAI